MSSCADTLQKEIKAIEEKIWILYVSGFCNLSKHRKKGCGRSISGLS